MTYEEAIELAADWWAEQVRTGNWDNGDAATEAMRNVFRIRLFEDEIGVLRRSVVELMSNPPEYMRERDGGLLLYSDYGNGTLDDACKKNGLNFSCLLSGPQKAGTKIVRDGDGWAVRACAGYRRGWETLGHLPPSAARC